MLRILAAAVLATACTHARSAAHVGTLDIMSTAVSSGDQARFLDVSSDGFDLTWVGGSAHFESAKGGECATGVVLGGPMSRATMVSGGQQRVELCPLGEGRWHAGIEIRSAAGPTPGDGFDFSTMKLPDGCISVERLGATWSVEIADHSPAAEVIRKHPELIGAAVAMSLLPLHHEHNITLVAARTP